MNKYLFISLFFCWGCVYVRSSCMNSLDCNLNGKCNLTTFSCECNSPYISYKGEECNYKRKSQLTAFLLQLFLGEFGAAEFYTEYYLFAFIKLGLVAFSMLSFCVAFKSGCGSICVRLVMTVVMVAVALWWIVDSFRYGMNKIPDGNGVSLHSWRES